MNTIEPPILRLHRLLTRGSASAETSTPAPDLAEVILQAVAHLAADQGDLWVTLDRLLDHLVATHDAALHRETVAAQIVALDIEGRLLLNPVDRLPTADDSRFLVTNSAGQPCAAVTTAQTTEALDIPAPTCPILPAPRADGGFDYPPADERLADRTAGRRLLAAAADTLQDLSLRAHLNA
jgi:hypothetical protein